MSLGPGARALLPVERALAELHTRLRPVEPRPVPIREAAGQVLAAPLQVSDPLPAAPLARRDGWAVASADLVGASSYTPVTLPVPPPWVETGDPLPAGTDALLPPDAVTIRSGWAEMAVDAAPGEGVRRIGEDAPPGAVLRPAGERLRPLDIAVALEAGIAQTFVRQPRVRVLSVPGVSASDASAEFIARLAEAAGARVERRRLPARDVRTLAGALGEGGGDLVLLVGGTGHGCADHAAEALAAAGSLTAHGLALRPGETSGCGFVGDRPVILVPGRLEAALAAALVLVGPCLEALVGASPGRPTLAGPLTRKVSSGVGILEIVLLRRAGEALEPLAAGDLTLTALAAAEGWLAVPPASEGFAAGQPVTAFVL